jgi:hypothetical protein
MPDLQPLQDQPLQDQPLQDQPLQDQPLQDQLDQPQPLPRCSALATVDGLTVLDLIEATLWGHARSNVPGQPAGGGEMPAPQEETSPDEASQGESLPAQQVGGLAGENG